MTSYDNIPNDVDMSFDLIILSGSGRLPIAYNMERLQKEIQLIQETAIPLIGKCLGCELINVAYGGTLCKRQEKIRGVIPITLDKEYFTKKTVEVPVYESHRWQINKLGKDLIVLGKSNYGIEIVKHRQKPLYGFQFHTEKMTKETYGDEIFEIVLQKILC